MLTMLCQVEGSVLAAMFSGRWEQCLDKDSQGHVFLDFDPHCFDQIVTFLRCHMRDAALGAETPAPVIKASKQHAYTLLVDYLGLQIVLGGCHETQTSTVEQPSYVFNGEVKAGVVDGAWSKVVCGFGEGQVILGPALAAGQVHYRKCRIDTLGDNTKQGTTFVGISPCPNWCEEKVVGSRTDRTGSHGWGIGPGGLSMWVDGQSEGHVDFGGERYRNIMLFQIDLVRDRLAYIFMGRQHRMQHAAYKMPLPSQFEQSMYFRVDMATFDSRLEVQARSLFVTESDKKLFDQPDLFV